MSVINRLIGRATGTAAIGIRANLPARFDHGEPGSNNNFSDLSENIGEPQSVVGLSAAGIKTEPTKPSTAAESYQPINFEIETTPAVPDNSSDEQPTISRPKPVVEAKAYSQLNPEIPLIDSTSQSPTTPYRNAGSQSETAEQVATMQQAPTATSNALNVDRKEPVTPFPESPTPLLPRVATPTYLATDALPATTAQQAPNSTDNQTTVPDINIHIGKIDLRTTAAKPAKTRSVSDKRSAMPSLADYLNGGAS